MRGDNDMLACKIAVSLNCSANDVKKVLREHCKELFERIVDGERIVFPNIGVFWTERSAVRKAYNFGRGSMEVMPHRVLKFKVSPSIRKALYDKPEADV